MAEAKVRGQHKATGWLADCTSGRQRQWQRCGKVAVVRDVVYALVLLDSGDDDGITRQLAARVLQTKMFEVFATAVQKQG